MKKILIALLIFISFSCPALASDWVYVGQNATGALVYLDKDSVIKSHGTAVGWEKDMMPDGSALLWRVAVRERDRAITVIFFANYDAEGKLIKKHTYAYREYHPIVPDTLLEVIYNFLMENAKSNV